MSWLKRFSWSICVALLFAACGEEHFSTPEKTLQRYVANKSMRTHGEIQKCLNCFRKADKKWWEDKYVQICQAKFGTFHSLCQATKVGESNIWSAVMEPEGPTTAEVDSTEINEQDGTAVLEADGMEVYFVKEGGNWKIDGFFGVDEELKEQYPDLR